MWKPKYDRFADETLITFAEIFTGKHHCGLDPYTVKLLLIESRKGIRYDYPEDRYTVREAYLVTTAAMEELVELGGGKALIPSVARVIDYKEPEFSMDDWEWV